MNLNYLQNTNINIRFTVSPIKSLCVTSSVMKIILKAVTIWNYYSTFLGCFIVFRHWTTLKQLPNTQYWAHAHFMWDKKKAKHIFKYLYLPLISIELYSLSIASYVMAIWCLLILSSGNNYHSSLTMLFLKYQSYKWIICLR